MTRPERLKPNIEYGALRRLRPAPEPLQTAAKLQDPPGQSHRAQHRKPCRLQHQAGSDRSGFVILIKKRHAMALPRQQGGHGQSANPRPTHRNIELPVHRCSLS